MNFSVSKRCIGCKSCTKIAKKHFAIGKNEKSFVKLQPKTEDEFQNCIKAITFCPVDAISYVLSEASAITPDSNIKDTLDKYPQLIDVLTKISNKFSLIKNPIMYNTLIRFISFQDLARFTKYSVCEILNILNKHLGLRDKLYENNPECANELNNEEIIGEENITWVETEKILSYNHDKLEEITSIVIHLQSKNNLVIIAYEKPISLLKTIIGLGFKFNIKIENSNIFRISVYNPR